MQSNFDHQSFMTLFRDPVSLEVIRNAVTLVPCCHKMEKVVAERFYGTIEHGVCSIQGKECLVCRRIVNFYYVDSTFQDVINRIFSLQNPLELMEIIPQESLAIVDDADVPFPGVSARFEHVDGQWREGDNKIYSFCVRHLWFKSTIENSLFRDFCLSGHEDGSLSLFVYFRYGEAYRHEGVWSWYLEYYKLSNFIDCGIDAIKISGNVELLQTLFRLLEQNNTIPEEYYQVMSTVVNLGRWE